MSSVSKVHTLLCIKLSDLHHLPRRAVSAAKTRADRALSTEPASLALLLPTVFQEHSVHTPDTSGGQAGYITSAST